MAFQVIEMTRVPLSSIRRASETGETGHHARSRSSLIERYRLDRAVRPCHAPSRFLAWRSATTVELRGLAGRSDPPSFVSPSGGTPGIVALRRFVPAARWGGISADPGPPAVLAARPPRLIFVGVTGRQRVATSKGRSAGDVLNARRRLLGFAPVCDPILRLRRRRIDPAMGFASCRVSGALPRIRPGSTPIGSSASGPSAERFSPSAPGFKSLQRIDGADASPT